VPTSGSDGHTINRRWLHCSLLPLFAINKSHSLP